MLGTIIYKKDIEQYGWEKYSQLAVWCNANDAFIVDMGDYYEATAYVHTDEEIAANELAELENWFEDYDLEVKKYERRKMLGIDPGIDILALHRQAEETARKIKELRSRI